MNQAPSRPSASPKALYQKTASSPPVTISCTMKRAPVASHRANAVISSSGDATTTTLRFPIRGRPTYEVTA